MPRHHAESTSSATPGKSTRTSTMVSARRSPSKPGREAVDQPRRREDADQHEQTHRERQRRADRARHAARRGRVALGEQSRVHRDEGRREHALAEEVLQQVGNPERGLQRVGDVGVAEVVGEARARAPGRRCGSRGCRARPAPRSDPSRRATARGARDRDLLSAHAARRAGSARARCGRRSSRPRRRRRRGRAGTACESGTFPYGVSST